MCGSVGGIIGSAVGGMIAGDSAEDAADAQAKAAGLSVEEQRRQFDLTREDLAPGRRIYGAATDRLGYELGLYDPYAKSLDDFKKELETSGKFGLKQEPVTGKRFMYNVRGDVNPGFDSPALFQPRYRYSDGTIGTTPTKEGGTSIDWTALNAEAQRLFNAQKSNTDGLYGSLNAKFAEKDYLNDPVTKIMGDFALREGVSQLNRRASAMGQFDNGQTLKALSRYASDYGAQRAGESRDRFNQDIDRRFNRYASVAGLGQIATTQGAQLGQQTANNISGIQTGLGNARGASSIAKGNVWGNTISGMDWDKVASSVFNPASAGGYMPGEYINAY